MSGVLFRLGQFTIKKIVYYNFFLEDKKYIYYYITIHFFHDLRFCFCKTKTIEIQEFSVFTVSKKRKEKKQHNYAIK